MNAAQPIDGMREIETLERIREVAETCHEHARETGDLKGGLLVDEIIRVADARMKEVVRSHVSTFP